MVVGAKGRVPRAVPLWWHLGDGSVVLAQPGRGGGCGGAWGHGVPQRVPVAAHSSRVSCSRHGWGRGTVLGTRGQRVAGARARGEAEPRALGAGVAPSWEVAGGTWLSGATRGTGVPSPAPSSRSQPKIPAETKVPRPGEAGAGVPHLPGFCSITARAPQLPCSISSSSSSSSSGDCWGPPLHPSGSEAGDEMPLCSLVPGTVMGCSPCGGSPGGSCDVPERHGPGREVVPVSPVPGSTAWPSPAGLSPARAALPARGWGHRGPEGLEIRAPRPGQAWGVGPDQRDDV